MKRLIALMSAVVLLCGSLCACDNKATDKMKDKASEAVADVKDSMTATEAKDDNNMMDNDRETVTPSVTAQDNTDLESFIATEWDDMVENGEVEDGDGNIGEAENKDGDGNKDESADD